MIRFWFLIIPFRIEHTHFLMLAQLVYQEDPRWYGSTTYRPPCGLASYVAASATLGTLIVNTLALTDHIF